MTDGLFVAALRNPRVGTKLFFNVSSVYEMTFAGASMTLVFPNTPSDAVRAVIAPLSAVRVPLTSVTPSSCASDASDASVCSAAYAEVLIAISPMRMAAVSCLFFISSISFLNPLTGGRSPHTSRL